MLCNLEEASRVARTVEENSLADAAPILAAPMGQLSGLSPGFHEETAAIVMLGEDQSGHRVSDAQKRPAESRPSRAVQ